jgi:PAS domain S-box-containing protein
VKPASDSARRIALLSKVGALAGTLEYDDALAAVARLSIPEFADWCVVDVVDGGELRRVEVAHRDPARAAAAERLRQLPPPPSDPARRQLLEGQPLFIPEYSDDVAIAHAWEPAYLELARDMGVRSLLVVPLVVRDAVVGVLSFVMTSESGRRYGEADLALAEELAHRAAAVVENARLHRDLKRSEERFRVALAHTHVSVFEIDRDLRYRWVYNVLLGLRSEDVVGTTETGLALPEDAVRLAAMKRTVLETGEPGREEIRFRAGGATRHLQFHMEPLRAPTGEIVGITGAVTDVTEQKQVQEELAEALAFRDRMLGILGHDLRNPASAVQMVAAALLKDGDQSERSRQGIVEIRRAAARMLEMIATLLDFSESRFKGALPISPVPMDLHEVTRAVVQEALAANPGRDVELAVRGDGGGRWDPARMGQVVSNLVVNAITYGAPAVPVRVSLDGDGEELRLRVWNGGAPIPPDLLPVLFEPFRRGGESRGRGLGLGLYIVKQIVVAHGGDVDVQSTSGGGTTFAVRLPRRLGAAPVSRRARTS